MTVIIYKFIAVQQCRKHTSGQPSSLERKTSWLLTWGFLVSVVLFFVQLCPDKQKCIKESRQNTSTSQATRCIRRRRAAGRGRMASSAGSRCALGQALGLKDRDDAFPSGSQLL